MSQISSAYESVGRIQLKLKHHTLAYNCFEKLVKLGQ